MMARPLKCSIWTLLRGTSECRIDRLALQAEVVSENGYRNKHVKPPKLQRCVSKRQTLFRNHDWPSSLSRNKMTGVKYVLFYVCRSGERPSTGRYVGVAKPVGLH